MNDKQFQQTLDDGLDGLIGPDGTSILTRDGYKTMHQMPLPNGMVVVAAEKNLREIYVAKHGESPEESMAKRQKMLQNLMGLGSAENNEPIEDETPEGMYL